MTKHSITYILFLLSLLFIQCTSKPYEAKAVYKPTHFDFGVKTKSDTVNVVFEVENAGKSDLILESVNPACQCTVSSYSKEPIESNQKGEIKVRYIPKPTDTGKVFQEIIVKTNSEKKLQVLTVIGRISK